MAKDFNVYKWRRNYLNENEDLNLESLRKLPFDQALKAYYGKSDPTTMEKGIFFDLFYGAPGLNEDSNLPAGAEGDPNIFGGNEPRMQKGKVALGNVTPVVQHNGEYLLFDEGTKHYIYTLNDAFDSVLDTLEDYLDVAQERYEDENGPYSSTSEDWRDYISGGDVLKALASYINDDKADIAWNLDEFESGEYPFLLITRENMGEIRSAVPSKFIEIIQRLNNLQEGR
jgi:hypothetical protein